jgi:choline dehydrogenase-like flavoprotein
VTSRRDRTLAAIVDTFVPATDGLPSASELGVHRRLLDEVRALARPSLQRQLDLLLRAIDTRAGNLALTGRATAFSALDQEAREAAMRRLAASPIPLKRTAFQDLKRLTLLLANRVLLFTAHQMSTCRIGTSPRDSVAGPDGRVHGVPGLYVTDASAMPTASGVNPVLSLMALARRTALGMAAT